jgi:phospholipase C
MIVPRRLVLAVSLLLLALASPSGTYAQNNPLPSPDKAGFEHVIVVMMENRSFDHFLGWVPGANGRQGGLSYLDSKGGAHPTHSLAPDYQGCGFLNPGHSYEAGRVQYNKGGADGWLLEGSAANDSNPKQANDIYAIGYYGPDDLKFFSQAAPAFTVCDNYFSSILSATYPNRFYMHSAQTDRLANTMAQSNLPTIWSRLEEKGLSRRYYFNDLPFLALWGSRYADISKPFAQFLRDAADGTLPNVAYVDPRFGGEDEGATNDDHPHADIRAGQAFLNQVYDAVRNSPNWSKTVLIINYDEWGGFYDHVPPPLAPIPPASAAAGDKDGRLGFRVPVLIISPYAQRGFVAPGQYDHTSILKMIEWRFGLPALTVRDETAKNLAEALDFSAPNLAAPVFNVPAGPFNSACPPSASVVNDPEAEERRENLASLRVLALKHGFKGVK